MKTALGCKRSQMLVQTCFMFRLAEHRRHPNGVPRSRQACECGLGVSGKSYSVDQLSEAGVRRISVGGSFARAAFGALKRAAEEVRDSGTFGYAQDAIPDVVMASLMSQDHCSETRVR